MINIALVEDDENYVKNLINHLKTYEKECDENFNISVFTDGEEILMDYSADFDIILMDVEMKFMDGMTTAEEIRKVDSEVVIIFITNMPQYAIKGYTVDALDYILKPVSYFAFTQRIERALSRMKRRRSKFLTIINKGMIQKVDISKIFYVEVQDHDLIFYTTIGKYITKGTMREIENSIDNQMFFRCNRCYLINLEYVESFQNSSVIIGNNIVQVSRARKREFLDRLNNYINEVEK